MSRPLVKDSEQKRLVKIQSVLNGYIESPKAKFIQLPIDYAKQLSELLNDILNLQPFVVEEEFLSPNEAAELASVSRPVIIEMLKNNRLDGFMVNTHWKVKKTSLLEYMNQREKTKKAMSAMDEDGFGLD